MLVSGAGSGQGTAGGVVLQPWLHRNTSHSKARRQGAGPDGVLAVRAVPRIRVKRRARRSTQTVNTFQFVVYRTLRYVLYMHVLLAWLMNGLGVTLITFHLDDKTHHKLSSDHTRIPTFPAVLRFLCAGLTAFKRISFPHLFTLPQASPLVGPPRLIGAVLLMTRYPSIMMIG